MGLWAQTIREVVPALATKAFSTVPTWQDGKAQFPNTNYETLAREGYSKNEIVFAAIDLLASSAGEPKMIGKRGRTEVHDHPLLDVLNRPNPFMTRSNLWSTLVMHRYIAGNGYIDKVRSKADKVVEYWTMRPDRVRVIPDSQKFIGAYEYSITGGPRYHLETRDVVHFKTRHPLDDYYGMSPLIPAAGRIDIDNYARDFVKSFFLNAGVPAGILNIKQALKPDQKGEIKGRFRQDFGGPRGWHELLVIDGTEASYTPMTMSLGGRGLVLPELDEIAEARTAMVFGVPLSLIGARLGAHSSSYANRRADWEFFWDLTMIPLLRDLAETASANCIEDFGGLDELVFDLDDIHALQEDVDKLHARTRSDYAGGLIPLEYAQDRIGLEDDERKGIYLIPSNMVPTPAAVLEQALADGAQIPPPKLTETASEAPPSVDA